jgi:hypothetical protein
MSDSLPVIDAYERPFDTPVRAAVAGASVVLTGQTFATQESLLAAIDHGASLSGWEEPGGEVASVGQDSDMSGIIRAVLKDLLGAAVEFAFDGTEVIDMTSFSMAFRLKLQEHPRYLSLGEVDQQRLLTGVFSILLFIRDNCTFMIAAEGGLVIDRPS